MAQNTAEDYQTLIRFLERSKLSRATTPEEWRLLEGMGMQDVARRYQEAWAYLCRRGITQLLRQREQATAAEAQAALDAAVAAIQRLATTP